MKLILKNKEKNEETRCISVGSKIRENEKITGIKLEIKNESIDKEYIELTEELLNVITFCRSGPEDSIINSELKKINKIISKYNNEQMEKFGLILQINDFKCLTSEFSIETIEDVYPIAKKIDDYFFIKGVNNKKILREIIYNKIKDKKNPIKGISEYNYYYSKEKLADNYIQEYGLKGEFLLGGYIFNISKIKNAELIKELFKDENIKKEKGQEDEEEFE